jgi:hypothetical protein
MGVEVDAWRGKLSMMSVAIGLYPNPELGQQHNLAMEAKHYPGAHES